MLSLTYLMASKVTYLSLCADLCIVAISYIIVGIFIHDGSSLKLLEAPLVTNRCNQYALAVRSDHQILDIECQRVCTTGVQPSLENTSALDRG